MMNKRSKERARQRELAQDFSGDNLSPEGFHAFYTKFINLRFPMKIENVLELRYLINHSVDLYTEPVPTPHYRQFRESLQSALDSFGIENRRHSERMLMILTMFRDLHYAHSIASRDAELKIRNDMEQNRNDYAKAVRYGLFFIFAAVSFLVIWLATTKAHLIIKLFPALYAWLALTQFHKLQDLDREYEQLTHSVNDTLRRRVNTVNWKTLIHKLSLVLGYKRIPGVEVFQMEIDQQQPDKSVYH